MMKLLRWILLCAISLSVFSAAAQYTVVNRNLTVGAGKVLHLDEAENAGIAWINGINFNTGTISFDVKGRDVLQGSFVGIAFHGLNDTTYEAVYLRPFNFRSADALRRSHAVQYIALPKFDWPVLREQFPNKYEQPVNPAPGADDWVHVKLVITHEKIGTYINGNEVPSLVVTPLLKAGGQKVGFWVGNTSPGDFKNLNIGK